MLQERVSTTISYVKKMELIELPKDNEEAFPCH